LSDQTLSLSHPSNDGHRPSKAAGVHSLAEILSQPDVWKACLAILRQSKGLERVRDRFGNSPGWLLIGCGSSYYVALAAAATISSLTKRPAQAIPASEILLYPELALVAAKDWVPIVISRSGRTSEVLKAAELLESRNFPTLAITCAPNQPLEKVATLTVCLPPADEQSTVMTRSFSSMLLTLQALAAVLAADTNFSGSLADMPAAAERTLVELPTRIREFAQANSFADYVCLGQGPFYGLACEYALKLTEMSLSYAQSFHTLEFRHGPKSIVSSKTLLVFLLSERGYDAECELLTEMKSLGAPILAVANQADGRVRAAANLVVELSLDLPELARLAPALWAGQLLGLYTGLDKGLDPDAPRNLSRVVTLEQNTPSMTSKHASL
jgi:glutamine---fructose-6-phosphate transaminase (isomerizing)